VSDEKRGRGRPAKEPPKPSADEKPPLEERAQHNLFSVFKLFGRAIGSSESLAEDEFADAGDGVRGLTLLFPKAKAEIEQIVDLLGPAATVVDLSDKVSRIFGKSKLKAKVDEGTAALKRRVEGEQSAS
jgi:hypothetical protein